MGREQQISELIKTKEIKIKEKDKKKKELKNKSLIFSLYEGNTKRNSTYTEEQAHSRADYLAKKLQGQKNYNFYLKCAWHLTDVYLDKLLGIALTKTSPERYFARAAANEMRKNG